MVRCVDCGLLCVRDPLTKQAAEADERFREQGMYRSPVGGKLHLPTVICHAGVRQLHEIRFGSSREVLETIGQEIDCNKFTKYQPGRSPKEIEEMSFQQVVFDLQKQQHELQKQHLEWERRQADQQAQLDKLKEDAEQKRHTRETRLYIIEITVAGLGVIVSAVVSFIVARLASGP